MGYFIHNKYDKNSVAALAALGSSSTHTVIDYYSNYETYKYLDTSNGFGVVYDALNYITPNTLVYDAQASGTKSHLNFSSSIIIKSIQRGIVTVNITNDKNGDGQMSVNINTIDPSKSIILLNAKGNVSNNTTICLNSLDSTQFTVMVAGYSNNYSKFSYQIIEFR